MKLSILFQAALGYNYGLNRFGYNGFRLGIRNFPYREKKSVSFDFEISENPKKDILIAGIFRV